MSVAWATLKKEMYEVFRDKRTLVLSILVPMVFYPALIMLAGGLGAKQQQKELDRGIKVGFQIKNAVDEQNKMLDALSGEDSSVVWLVDNGEDIRSKLQHGDYNVYVESSVSTSSDDHEQLDLRLHYFSTARGEVDLKRVKKVINAVKMQKYEAESGKLISVVGLQDYASVRESAGSKFGGVAAYFLVFLAFTGCMAVAVDVAAGEKERGTLEAMLVTPVSFWELSFGKLIFVVIMGLLSVVSTAIGIGSMVLLMGNTVKSMSLGGVGFVSVFGIIVLLVVLVFFFAVLLFGLSILAKSSKEAHMRSSLLMLVIAMALVYCTLPGVELTGSILVIPVLNVAMALRALWEGSISLGEYALVLSSLIALSGVILWYVSRKVRNNAESVLLK